MPFLVALVAAFSIGHAYRTTPAALAPALAADLGLEPWALGVFGGRWLIRHVSQRLFEWMIVAFSAIAGLRLMFW